MTDHKVIADGLAFPEGPVWLPDHSLIIVELAAVHNDSTQFPASLRERPNR